MDEKILDEILPTDSRIRYVGILSSDLKEVKSKMRRGVKLLLGNEADEVLVKVLAPVVLGALSQFTDRLGRLFCSIVRYEKVTLIFFKMGDMHVVVSTEPVAPYDIAKKLEEKLQI
jgi:hypothetical protein